MDLSIPDELTIRARNESVGASEWLATLKSDVESVAAARGLKLVGQLRLGQELAMSFLVRLRDGRSAVLRAVEDCDVVRRQATVLELWRDRPAVDLLDVDVDRRMLLIEALCPDRDLHSVDRSSAARIASVLLSQLWVPAEECGQAFSVLAAADLLVEVEGIDPALVDEGEAARKRRDRAADRLVVLHGDLHRGNVLARADGTWAAIDPLPIIGPPAVDLGILISDLIADDVDSPAGRHRLTALVGLVVSSVPARDVTAAAVLDWMLLHRLNRVGTAAQERRDAAWDTEFARLIVSVIASN